MLSPQQCCLHGACSTSRAGRMLVRVQAAQANPLAQSQAELMSLVPWAVKNGIQFSKIKPSIQPDSGRGLVATADIQPGECVCAVPVSAAIRVYPGCPAFLQVPTPLWQELPWYAQLALTLLSEQQQGTASKWCDYIRQLPPAVDLPALWSDQELQQLRCEYFIKQVQQQQQDWRALEQLLSPHMQAAGITSSQLYWALSIARSRTFAAPYTAALGWLKRAGGQQQQQHVLCPFLDLFNHRGDVQSECEFYSSLRSSSFRVVTSQTWRRGDQVYINYGEGSNDTLLQLYGFVERGNPQDRWVVCCLLDALKEQGVVGLTAEQEALLAEVAFMRSSIEGRAAAVLQRLLPGVSGDQCSTDHSPVPYAALSEQARGACTAAVQRELLTMAVDATADLQVLQAFEQLPAKLLELEGKHQELSGALERLQQLQHDVDAQQAADAAAAVGASSSLQQEQQAQHQTLQVDPLADPLAQPPTYSSQQQEAATASGYAAEGSQPLTTLPAAAQGAQKPESELPSVLEPGQQLCERLSAEVAELQELTTHWQQLTAQHKQVAVLYRLQKHKLLVAVLHSLQSAEAGSS